jgi:chromosome segregation ATPase
VRLGFAISTVAAAAFIGVYFQVEVAAFLTRYNFGELASQESRKPDSVALRPQAEVEQVKAQLATLDAAQITQAVETSALEARQSSKNEQRSEASANEPATLMQEAKAAQAMAADAEPQRRALDEAQARAAALASELDGTRREIETQTAQSQKAVDAATKQKQAADSRLVHVTQAVKTAVTEPSKAAEVQGNAEAAKLIARASALLGQGDIGAARIVLERASESGNAKASFMLAETYDPAILTAWGTYGTRGEVTKARELYAKADAGGIQEAKNRLNALRQ